MDPRQDMYICMLCTTLNLHDVQPTCCMFCLQLVIFFLRLFLVHIIYHNQKEVQFFIQECEEDDSPGRLVVDDLHEACSGPRVGGDSLPVGSEETVACSTPAIEVEEVSASREFRVCLFAHTLFTFTVCVYEAGPDLSDKYICIYKYNA